MDGMEQVQLDQERQRKAKEYSRISRRLMVVDLLLTAAYSIAWLVFGWSLHLKTWMDGITFNPFLQVLLFAAIFGGIIFVIDLPLSYYSEFILPHRFEQSNEDLRSWAIDQCKGLVVSALLGGLVLEVIYAILRAFPDTWWILASIVLLFFSIVLANLAPILIFPLFNKFIPLGEEHKDLIDRLNRLFENAGSKVNGVYKFDMSRRTKSANAALTGIGKTRRIILGDTLINEFSPDEIETVMAHELGHHVNRDIPLLIVLQLVSTVLGLWLASLGLHWGVRTFGFSGPADIAALPVFMLVMGGYGLVTMPVTNAFSRWRERLADLYALKTTHNPPAFISAMTRLANQNLSEVDPEPWVEFLLHSHPSLQKRIQMAERYPGPGK
jgi:STE24 endopeptidase